MGVHHPTSTGPNLRVYRPSQRVWPLELRSSSPSPNVKASLQRTIVDPANSRGHAILCWSLTAIRGPGQRSGTPSTQVKGPQERVGFHQPNSRTRANVRKSITPRKGAAAKHGSPSPQLDGPRQRIHHPALGANPKVGISSSQPQTSRPSIGVCHPTRRGQTKAWESINPSAGDIPKCGSPSP